MIRICKIEARSMSLLFPIFVSTVICLAMATHYVPQTEFGSAYLR
jgi:hypothetical protein